MPEMSDGAAPVSDRRDPSPDGSVVRLRLDVAYDGTDFSGWALQPGRRTVQGVLETALRTVLRGPAALTVAGRTDTGVHAIGQVAHVDVPSTVWDQARASLVRQLAGLLPPDVRVCRAARVPADFDARFGALWRRYEYRICDAPAGVDPLRRVFVLGWRRSLEAERMAAGAHGLLGEHDFAAYCRHRDAATAVRTLQALDVCRDGAEIVCTVQADAFCHSMVRSLVGALLAVGDGRRGEDWPASLLERRSRADDVSVAPAQGLTLVAVGYPPDHQLSARSQLTRQRRRLSR
jgi:tRNA pseudouridine38-40 synthase